MIAIWHQLVDDPRATIDAHFDAIAKELLREMGGRLWRSRQTSAAGLADLLQGRRWDQLGPHLLPAWSMTLRVMDDIKDSVRQAGLALARSLKSVTLRLTDAGASGGATVAAAVAAVLPTLLERGLHSSVVEVQALSLDTIAKLVKGAGEHAGW